MRAMTQEVSELLKKALALPSEARAALAGSLLESLDETIDPSAEEQWSKEIDVESRNSIRQGKAHPLG